MRVPYRRFIRWQLLVGVGIHEMPILTIAVEILHGRVHDVCRLNAVTRLKGLLDDAAGFEVTHTGPGKCLALARFDEFVFNDGVGIAVQHNLQATFEFIRVVRRHGVASSLNESRIIAGSDAAHSFKDVNIRVNTGQTTKIIRLATILTQNSMDPEYRAINTLVLVENAQQADSIAAVLRLTGIPVQQSWVTMRSDFSSALQRDAFDLGIIYCAQGQNELPSSMSRYPDIPFLAIMDKFKNRAAETLLEHGMTEVVGLSQPLRLHRVLHRLLSETSLRHENESLRLQQKRQDSLIHSMLQHSSTAVAYLHQGAHSYANASYQQLTGLAHLEDVQQTPLLDLIASSDRNTVASTLRQIEAGHSSHASLSVQLQRTDGDRLTVDLELLPSFFDGESMVQLTAVSTPDTRLSVATAAAGSVDDDCEKFDATVAIVPVSDPRPNDVVLFPINNLRQDIRERLLVSYDQDTSLSRLPGIDFGAFDLTVSLEEQIQQERELDRWLIDQSLDWLQQHQASRPDAQLFVPVAAPVSEHSRLVSWLKRQLQQRAIAPSSLAIILRYDADRSAAWERLAKALAETGVNVCAAAIDSLSATDIVTQNPAVNFAFLNNPGRDQVLTATLTAQIERCRAAEIKTVANVTGKADIASAWKSGLDCFVDQTSPA